MSNYKDLMIEFRVCASGDNWGDTMSAWFEAAGHMFERGLPIPSEWDYSPGLCATEPDGFWYAPCDAADDDGLTRFARTLARYSDILRAAGEDY